MDFTSFADADAYMKLGSLCASALQGDAAGSCYNALRGIGVVILYALPH